MTTRRTNSARVSATALCAALLCAAPAIAQDHEGRSTGYVNINFAGGPVASYVELVSNQAKYPMNIIIEDGLEPQMGPLSMKQVAVPVAIELIGELAVDPTGIDLHMERVGGEGSSVYLIRRERNARNARRSASTGTTVWPLQEIVQGSMELSDIVSAVEASLGVGDQQSRRPVPQIVVHEDTKLLIAHGDDRTLSTIDDVIEALTTAAHHNMQITSHAHELSKANTRIAELEAEVAALKRGRQH